MGAPKLAQIDSANNQVELKVFRVLLGKVKAYER